jgi:hypothetical protein
MIAMNAKNRTQLKVEALEERLAMTIDITNIYPSGDMLVIVGTSGNDEATVTASGPYLTATLNGYSETYYASDFARIGFWGGAGNDSFWNQTGGPCEAYGEGDNDILIGGAGNDYLSGGDYHDYLDGNGGNDTLKGGYGDDTLWGGTGNDVLWGQQGNDGLMGGTDYDLLYGGTGADRFLRHVGESTVLKDKVSHDIELKFANSRGVWSLKEMEIVDLAFKKLHDTNPRLLKDSNSAASVLTFYKAGSQQSEGWSGLNVPSAGKHKIYIADWDESSTAANEAAKDTVLHEIGHNWEDENRYWGDFLRCSGWTRTIPSGKAYLYYAAPSSPVTGKFSGWYYLKSRHGNFASDYARTSPYEDFAETFASYFMGETHGGVLTTKFAFMNSWLATL